MKFPWISLVPSSIPVMKMPPVEVPGPAPLPAITLRAAAVVPPIRSLRGPSAAYAAVPDAEPGEGVADHGGPRGVGADQVALKDQLARRDLHAFPARLPEITLPAPAAVPPIVNPSEAPARLAAPRSPIARFPNAAAPVASTPT